MNEHKSKDMWNNKTIQKAFFGSGFCVPKGSKVYIFGELSSYIYLTKFWNGNPESMNFGVNHILRNDGGIIQIPPIFIEQVWIDNRSHTVNYDSPKKEKVNEWL